MEELEGLDEFLFPRCTHWEKRGTLVAFSDTSKDAYGAAVYMEQCTRQCCCMCTAG